jgi:hypothetical protein
VTSTRPSGTDWALARGSRPAPDHRGASADELYREAIERLGPLPPSWRGRICCTREWLRRVGRRLDAREQLRTAFDMLGAIGIARSPSAPAASCSTTGDGRAGAPTTRATR